MLRFRSALDAVFGARIERVVLFGSRARGDHRPDSDDDVAVFLRDDGSFGGEWTPILDIEDGILRETGSATDALSPAAGSHRDPTSVMGELRRDGVDL